MMLQVKLQDATLEITKFAFEEYTKNFTFKGYTKT